MSWLGRVREPRGAAGAAGPLRAFPLVPLAVAAAVPAFALPAPGIAAVAAAGAMLAAAGAVARVPVLVAVGAGGLLADYALALWLAGAPPDPLGAAVLGVGLLLALETADFHWRFSLAHVPAPVLKRQILRWGAGIAAGLVASTALAALALVGLRLPPGVAPVLAAAGAIGAVAALAAALSRLTAPPAGEDNPPS
jgi:hypothetical protein